MNSPMTDERALELVRWLTNGSDATPPPPDVTLQQAYNHIAARLSALQAQQPDPCPQCPPGAICKKPSCKRLAAQQPGAQAVAWRYLNPPDEGSTEWVASRWYDFPDEAIAAYERRGQRIEYAYLPQPPSIPEPSDADVRAFIDAVNPMLHPLPPPGVIRAALATYTARLRERIGGGA